MARQRDRHHARPRDRPTRGSRGPHHPAQGPQGRPPARGQAPSPRPGPNHLREGGLPPGIRHALPDPLDPAPLATHGDRALGLGHPHRPHTSRGGPGHATKPPPPDCSNPSPAGTRPSTRCSTAWVVAQSEHTPFPPLTKRSTRYASSSAKSLPRQQKTASFSSKPPGLQLATKARRGEQTHTPTQHTPPHSLRPCPSPLAAHEETHTRPPSRAPPGPATRASPTRPNTSTRPPHTHPPDTPHNPQHSTTHTQPPRGAPRPAARPPHPVARPRPLHTPQKTQAHPPRPLNAAREPFPPADANPHNLAHCRTRAQPSPEGEGHSPAPPSPAAADQIGPPGRQVTTGPPQPPAPNLQPEDMPSILPAVAAAEAAARKPARITA